MKLDSSSLYRKVIKRSFLITWENRFLWVFGLFTAFLGLGSMYNIILKDNSSLFYGFANRFGAFSASGIIISKNLDKVNWINLVLIFVAFLIAMAAFVFLTWLAIRSFGSLIKAGQMLDKKKETNLKKSFEGSKGHFWALLFINILGKALIFLFLALTGGVLSMILINHSVGRALLYFFASLFLVAVSLLISFLIIYASCFVVLKSKNISEAVYEAWELFKQYWVISIEAAVILFFIDVLVKIGLAVVLVLMSVPFMVLLLIFYSASMASMPAFILGLWVVLGVLVMIAIGSFFAAFKIIAWTLLFDKMSKGGILSKLQRIFG